MKTKLQYSVTPCLLILGLGFCVATAQAQEQKDPYKKPAANVSPAVPAASSSPTPAAATPEEPDMNEDYCVTATIEWIDLSTGDAMSLMRGGLAPNSKELIQKIRDFEAQGRATLVEAQSITTKSGQRATSEGTKEFIYPTEFHPFETKGLSEANINLSNTPVKDGKIIIQQEAPGSAPPTAFEMRPVGGRFELDPVIRSDGKTLDLNMAPEYTIFTGWQEIGKVRIGGETLPMVEQPLFATTKITTAVTIESGQTIVAGMTNVQKEDGTIDATKKRFVLVHGMIFPIRPQ
ncbi:hypothetical protein BH11VER1_BH11VER1_07000 [soil metagenome]